MEDVLDSLLGLPAVPSSRSPSPGPGQGHPGPSPGQAHPRSGPGHPRPGPGHAESANALCRRVASRIKAEPQQVSALARQGYMAHGRGAVKLLFSSPELAERWLQEPAGQSHGHFPGPGGTLSTSGAAGTGPHAIYVRWTDLLPDAALYADLVKLCRSYDPHTRLVLYVCVSVRAPGSEDRVLVARVSKVRLHDVPCPCPRPGPKPGPKPGPSISRDSDNPETLILTSLPARHDPHQGPAGPQGFQGPQDPRSRELSLCNIQRQLRQRGVCLRKHFPDVYARLVAYVEGRSERFTPVTVYPLDKASGKSFMCIIMPGADPDKLQLLPEDSSRVQTIDVSVESEP